MLKQTFFLSSFLLLGLLSASPVVRPLANFRDARQWELKKPAAISAEFRSDGLLQLEWKKTSSPSTVELLLKTPAPVDPEAQRAGLKLFVRSPMDRNKLYLLFIDRTGTRFSYPLPELEK